MTDIKRVQFDGVDIQVEPAPPYVSRTEVEGMKLRFGSDDPFVQDRMAELETYETWLADRKRENDALRDARDAKRERERTEMQERIRTEEADKRAAEVRTRGFRANSHASDADFDRLKQRLADDEMVENARGGKDDLMDEMRALRGSGQYSM